MADPLSLNPDYVTRREMAAALDEVRTRTAAGMLALRKQIQEETASRVESAIAQIRSAKGAETPSMSIIASRGTLDWGYPPFILASTAAALGWEVSVFFTFYGLQLLRKDLSGLRVSPLGNPAMPMQLPFGPEWFRTMEWNIPNAIMANVPFFEAAASGMMRKTMRNTGIASLEELRSHCVEAEVKFSACMMTAELFGFHKEEFIDEVEYVGAAAFLPVARTADVCLFV